jgi:diadenosine tetraphosphate (Ap4A) HIT family hydrolase
MVLPAHGAEAIASNEHAVVLLNRFAQRRAHLLVASREHVEHVHQMDWTAYSAMQQLAHQASCVVQRLFSPERVFIALLGRSSLPPVPSYAHLHVHVIPVYERDERARPARVLSWGEGVVIYEDVEARALADQLRTAWTR